MAGGRVALSLMSQQTCKAGIEHLLEPDAHLCCKLTYWRTTPGGGLQVTYAGGQERFHNEPSVYQRERDEVALAKERGVKLERPNW